MEEFNSFFNYTLLAKKSCNFGLNQQMVVLWSGVASVGKF